MEKNEIFIKKNDKELRCGFTTGSCAAAAAKASLMMLLTGEEVRSVSINTPKNIPFLAEIVDITRDEENKTVTCGVVKDGGDDPDVTTGMVIYACVCLMEKEGIEIDGGTGIGRVTRKGLDRDVGEAAINTVPRQMITEAALEVLKEHGIADKGVKVLISAPRGEEVAQKTFNPKLGIVGGISILGTTGIVEPMSDAAIVDTVKVQIRMRASEDRTVLLTAPGNYGLSFLEKEYGIIEEEAVLCSNFVYDTLMLAKDNGFKKVLLVGHLGKLVKVAGGIKNTHSAYGDHRMEILCGLIKKFAPEDIRESLCEEVSGCVMTDAAVDLIEKAGLKRQVFDRMAIDIKANMESWSDNRVTVETIVFSNDYTFLASTPGAGDMLDELKEERKL